MVEISEIIGFTNRRNWLEKAPAVVWLVLTMAGTQTVTVSDTGGFSQYLDLVHFHLSYKIPNMLLIPLLGTKTFTYILDI